MLRVLEISSFNSNVFTESNWTFYLKEIFPFYKNYNNLFLDELLLSQSHLKINIIFSINLLWIPLTYLEVINVSILSVTSNFVHAITQISNYVNFLYIIDINNTYVSNSSFIFTMYYIFNFFISLIFFCCEILLFYFNFHTDYGSTLENTRTILLMFYEEFILIWTRFASIKFESYEEAICILILWPWCIFLVFTHIFSVENNEIFFIFVEWGLPVIYGYLILIESIWLFSTYFFVYLNGARGRRLFLVTLLEDLIAFAILP